MAELTEALGEALAARYPIAQRGRPPKSGADSPRGLRARANRILGAFGGNRKKAAAASGIPYSTFKHALNGRGQAEKTRNKVLAAFEQFVTSPARARAVQRGTIPGEFHITAVVVVDPGDPEESPEDNRGGRGGSRYVNGHGSGLSREEAAALGPEDPGYRTFKGEGLDGERIVGAWLTGGDEGAAGALLDEVAEVYGSPIGFEGDNVRVELL